MSWSKMSATQPHAAVRDQRLAVRRDDARRLLPAVLERVERRGRRGSPPRDARRRRRRRTLRGTCRTSPPRRSLPERASGMYTRRSAAEPALERPPPALARRLDRQVDEVADHEALPAHLAEDREAARPRAAPGRAAGPGAAGAPTRSMRDWLSPKSSASAADAALDARRARRAAGRRSEHSASATASPPSATSCAERRSRSCAAVEARRGGAASRPRGRSTAARRARCRGSTREVLAAAELLARAAEQDDDVALGLPPRREVRLDVVEQADHGDRRRRRNAPALGLVVEAHVAADDRRAEREAGVADAVRSPAGTATSPRASRGCRS